MGRVVEKLVLAYQAVIVSNFALKESLKKPRQLHKPSIAKMREPKIARTFQPQFSKKGIKTLNPYY